MFVVCIRKGEQIRDGTLIGFLKLNLITHVCTVCVCVCEWVILRIIILITLITTFLFFFIICNTFLIMAGDN